MRCRPTSAPVNCRAMPDDGSSTTWAETLVRVTVEVGDRAAAKWLCQTASGHDAEEFAAILDLPVGERAGLHLEAMLRRLAGGEPLQYVLGRWGFRRLDVMVDARVLIPRPETEQLVDAVLQRLAAVRDHHHQRRPCVVDLGTGSGVIGLSVLAESAPESVDVWMTDVSVEALDVARANCAGLGRAGARARFASGRWYEALPVELVGSFDVIVSNPPYVADADDEVEDVVRLHEPDLALFAGPDGLDALRAVVAGAPQWLSPGGQLIVEIGHRQADAVSQMFVDAGLGEVDVRDDLAGRPRMVSGTR